MALAGTYFLILCINGMDKSLNQLRQQIKLQRQKLSAQQRQPFNHTICQQLQQLAIYQQASNVGLYFSVNGEVDTTDIWHLNHQLKKTSLFPVLSEHQHTPMTYYPCAPGDNTQLNRFNITEPSDHHLPTPSQAIDLVVVPLVAFDHHCHRIGMGAGYYDRTFSYKLQSPEKKPWLVGVAYGFQQVDHIAPQAWDIPLDLIITEHQIFWRDSCDTGL